MRQMCIEVCKLVEGNVKLGLSFDHFIGFIVSTSGKTNKLHVSNVYKSLVRYLFALLSI